MTAVTWPVSMFELDSGQGLAVCVAHRGEHAFHNGGCVAFAAQRMPKTLRVRLTRQDRPVEPERAPVEVQLDETKLAAGIALALDRLMERRRRSEADHGGPQSPPIPGPASPGNGRSVRGIASDD